MSSTRVLGTSTVERRAADCIVLGNSTLAAAIATSLARRQKKVIHIADMGLEAARPYKETLRPLVLPDKNVHLCRLADESASYLRGLELQMGTDLVHRCRSLDLGPRIEAAGAEASRASGGAQGSPTLQSAVALERLAASCKDAHIKLGLLTESELLAPFPMLRPRQLMGLLQPDGAVVNARKTHEALLALAARSGVLAKSHLVLRGWQDTGSSIRVRASSSLQSDAMSLFEAEQLVLAPGDWVPDALNLFGLELNVQMRERLCVRCPCTEDLSRLPLLRFWGGLRSAAEEGEQQDAAAQRRQRQQLEEEQQLEQGVSGRGRGAGQGLARGRDGGAAAGDAGVGGAQWVLFPPSSGRQQGKLSSTQSQRTPAFSSCWEWHPPSSGAQSPLDAELLQPPLRTQRRQVGALVRGLGTDDDALLEMQEGLQLRRQQQQQRQGQPRVMASAAVDLLTPDGLPVLGWHPGFEAGRILIAFTSSGSFGWDGEQQPASVSTPDTRNRSMDSTGSGGQREQGSNRDGASTQRSSGSTSSSTTTTTTTATASSSSGSVLEGSAWPTAGTDGYQLSLAVAVAACHAITGLSTEGDGLLSSSAAMSLQRPCLQSKAVPEVTEGGDMLEGGLQKAQDGTAWKRKALQRMSDEQLQAREQQEVIARRAKAGGLGKLKAPAQKVPKQFFLAFLLHASLLT